MGVENGVWLGKNQTEVDDRLFSAESRLDGEMNPNIDYYRYISAGAIATDKSLVVIDTGTNITMTLASPSSDRIITICNMVPSTGDVTITPTSLLGYTSIVLAAGKSCRLIGQSLGWQIAETTGTYS